jgi:Histidine kinase-, DNA gyrase B-, and HSP90-like ATPase
MSKGCGRRRALGTSVKRTASLRTWTYIRKRSYARGGTLPVHSLQTKAFRGKSARSISVTQAQLVEVELEEAHDKLQVVVRDDGRGFDVSATRKRAINGGSQGLLSMQERVALAGGDLEIHSAPGHGTCIRARLPLIN